MEELSLTLTSMRRYRSMVGSLPLLPSPPAVTRRPDPGCMITEELVMSPHWFKHLGELALNVPLAR